MTSSTQSFQKSPAPHTFFSKMTSSTQSFQKPAAPHTKFLKNQQHHTKSFKK